MKKLFTLIAFLACFMGAKAEWVKVHTVDYSQFKGFPYYVMGYVPEWFDGVMTDMGGNYTYAEAATAETTSDVIVTTNAGVEYYRLPNEGTWHQYFFADGIPTEIDGAYTLRAMVKASEPVSIPVQMRWSWGEDPVNSTLSIGTEWEEVECDFTGIGGSSCSLIAQPNTAAQIEWKYIEIWQNKKQSRPVEWLEMLTNGDAETPWGELADVKYNDMENNYKVCAWSKQKGTNVDDNGGSNPFPAEIVEIEDGGHAFIVRGAVADTEGDPSAWDNQFWIESPKEWREGTQVKLHFRYKASQPAAADTQIHHQTPSDYLHWQAVGEVNFTTEWQTLDKTFTFDGSMSTGWSVAFNLNKTNKDAVDFYFDDLSWQVMKLDSGLVAVGKNDQTGIAYDYDFPVKFEYDEAEDALKAIVGEVGKPETWVSEIQISTVSGEKQAFLGNTIKPAYVKNDPEDWCGYVAATNYKIKLPAAGVWQILVAEEESIINFVKLEGEEEKEPIVITPNETEVIVNAVERAMTIDEAKAAGLLADNDNPTDDEKATYNGQPWDNQFFIVCDRAWEVGEVVVVEFDYMADIAATVGTQNSKDQGNYLHWAGLGNIEFTTDWQHFSKTVTIPSETNGNQNSWTFNLSNMQGANTYHFKNIVVKDEAASESFISMEGTRNFFVKQGANTGAFEFGSDPTSIVNVNNKVTTTTTYNLAGQRVSKDFKGIVLQSGRKFMVK